MERLQKVLAHAGVASRRAAERLIVEGRVTVNGRVVTELGTRVDPARDAVKVDGTRLRAVSRIRTHLLLHKPRGYVTTLSDPQGRPTIRDLIGGVKSRVYPVGRLDFHSEGLLLLTDDGELARDLMDPRRRVPKTYHVKVRGKPDAASLERLRRGVLLDGRRTRPASVKTLRPGENPWLEMTIVEGRNRQIRRMCLAVGHRVVKLRRVRFGPLELGRLGPGEHRPLTGDEVERLRRAAGAAGQGTGRPRARVDRL
jgi:pseudouridine synthase